MIDRMAYRYGMLPSQVLSQATTQDVYIFDVSVSYDNYLQEKANRKNGVPGQSQTRMMDSEDLLKGFERYHQRKRDNGQ